MSGQTRHGSLQKPVLMLVDSKHVHIHQLLLGDSANCSSWGLTKLQLNAKHVLCFLQAFQGPLVTCMCVCCSHGARSIPPSPRRKYGAVFSYMFMSFRLPRSYRCQPSGNVFQMLQGYVVCVLQTKVTSGHGPKGEPVVSQKCAAEKRRRRT